MRSAIGLRDLAPSVTERLMRTPILMLLVLAGPALLGAAPLTLISNGKAQSQIWHAGEAGEAAEELATYLEQISGARPPVHATTDENPNTLGDGVVAVGELAFRLGLPTPPESRSNEGYRIQRKGQQLLIGGETSEATYFAVCHFLETLGVRWFFDNEIGTVIPKNRTITIDELNIAEAPDFIHRSVSGANWHKKDWGRHNRLGGISMATSHGWSQVSAKEYFDEHPEYFALRGGERQKGGWLCTSNPEMRKVFAAKLVEEVGNAGPSSVSLSPPDGTGFCECEACVAQDVPDYIEPSSGRVAISDRYQDFYNYLGREVLKVNPKAILSYYAYSDYTLPPKRVTDSPENLCVWMAPIRFCRLHGMANHICEDRLRLAGDIKEWMEVAPTLGWREYNYNLAELVAPYSKVSIWSEDLPALHKQGCVAAKIETLAHWHIYGPHIYLTARLLWDIDADAGAVMDDFYTKFCGSAAPHVKAYWERVDKAYHDTDNHIGSFYSLHAVWTPEMIAACQADLKAASATADDDLIKKRVAMFQMGLDNAVFYIDLREATNRCDFMKAQSIFDEWLAHMDAIHEARIHTIGEYKRGYAPRFLGKTISAGAARVSGENRLVVQLPDEYQFRYDHNDEGEKLGWHKAASGDGWRPVKTYSAMLTEQGIDEELTWLWYVTEFDAPEFPKNERLSLWIGEVDGVSARIFLNGELAGEGQGRRSPMEAEVTGKLRAGKNTVAIKIDHSRISELKLGGIIKPAMIYAGPGVPEESKTK